MSFQYLRLSNLKNKKVTSAKFSRFVIYVKVITYFLYYLLDCTFKICRFHGLLGIMRKLIHSKIFPEVLFKTA